MGQRAEFVLSAPSWRQLPPARLPEVAFCGRSNVGKSSLCGAVLGAPRLVRTSRTPGRTQLLNFFRGHLDGRAYGLCDLPGYGWAKLSQAQRANMRKMVGDYLRHREQLVGVVLLVDGRREAVSPLDRQMYADLQGIGRPIEVVASKCDHLAKNTRGPVLGRIGEGLGAAAPPSPSSTLSGEGIDRLASVLHGWVQPGSVA